MQLILHAHAYYGVLLVWFGQLVGTWGFGDHGFCSCIAWVAATSAQQLVSFRTSGSLGFFGRDFRAQGDVI